MRAEARPAREVVEPLHPQDAAALARLRARLKLTPSERWELWDASMRSLEGWQGIARKHAQRHSDESGRPAN